MSPKCPIGKNTITNLAKEAVMLCGVDEWKDFGLHDCRHEFVTRLVNSPEVSVSETMAAARHTSISASKQYQ